MTTEKKFDVSKLKLENIVVRSASFENDDKLVEFEAGTRFKVRSSLQPGIDVEQKRILLLYHCNAEAFKNDISFNARCIFEIAYIFHIENLEELIEQKELIEVDDDLANSIANIAYSTSRGIIFTRCQGTIFNKLIIPVVATNQLINLLESKEESTQ